MELILCAFPVKKLSAYPAVTIFCFINVPKFYWWQNFTSGASVQYWWDWLDFKLLPMKAYAQETTLSGLKKGRIIMTHSNATRTHKLPLFVIGRSMKYCTFKNLNITTLPVYYKTQKYRNQLRRMYFFFIRKWFKYKFVPQVKKHLTQLKIPTKTAYHLFQET